MNMDALLVIREYSWLQRRLVEQLFEAVKPQDRSYFRDVPNDSLVVDGAVWTYNRHGAGIIFQSNRGVVDAHVGAGEHPDAVDAWRLEQYCESRGVTVLEHRGDRFAADDQGALDDLLKKLVAEGALRVVEQEHRGPLYIP
jgi:hypothetical protein